MVAEAWPLSDWGAYENISPAPWTNLYLSNVMLAVVTASQTLRVPPLLQNPQNKVIVLLGCCYILVQAMFSQSSVLMLSREH